MSHELRTPLNAGHRLLRRAARADVRRAERAPGGVRPRHPRLGPPPARADQRDPRPVEGRGGPDGARARAPCRFAELLDARRRDGARARRPARHRAQRSTSRPDVGAISADELKLKQVVLNLLTNAVKFTPDGGSVVVTARLRRRRCAGQRARHRHRHRRGRARAHLRGVPARRPRARGAARRAPASGLTLSRRIVELHGGRLWMESELGVGSTFTFAIPVGAPAPAARRAAEPRRRRGPAGQRRQRAGGRGRPPLRRPAAALPRGRRLRGRRRRATASRASSWRGGSARRRSSSTCCCRGSNGWDVLARLKADPATAAIPVVIVSMLDERGAGLRARRRRVPGQAGRPRASCSRAARAASRRRATGARWWRSTTTRVDLDLVEAVLAPEG